MGTNDVLGGAMLSKAKDTRARAFISYNWKNQDVARQIENALKEDPLLAENLSVWRDETNVQPGHHLSTQLTEALSKTDYFILLVSENSNSSTWVKREIDTAVGLADKKKLVPVPVLLEQVEVPFEFRGLLYIDGRKSVSGAIKMLVDFLRSQLSTIASIEPKQMFRKSAAPDVLAWNECQDKLRKLQLKELRRPLADKLSLTEIKVLWYDLFGRKMDDEVPQQSLPLCCIELLERARREEVIAELIDRICRDFPRVSASL